MTISTVCLGNSARARLFCKANPNYLRKALYRVFTWAEIEPIYGQPWKESLGKAVESHKMAAKRRRKGSGGGLVL